MNPIRSRPTTSIPAAFAFSCLLSAPAPAAARPLQKPPTLEDLQRDLRAPRPETRRSAVRKLALLGEPRAWDLVLRALEDREPEVADEAQIALGAAGDPRLADLLLGRAGLRAQDPWVRLRAAEALGRLGAEVDGEALARAIAPGDAELSRTLLWSIERSAAARHLGGDRDRALRAARRVVEGPGDPGLRAAALAALSALDPIDAHGLATAMLEAREPELRCAALGVLAAGTEQECLTASRRLLDDPEPAVRTQAVENLERLGSRAAILALVARMEVEPRARLRWRVLGHLRAISGLDHAFDAEAWRTWAGSIEGRWSTGDGAGAPTGPAPGAKAAISGLELLSDRVCFLVDLSGSTWETKFGDRTRKQVLDAELRRALEALPEGTRFNLVPYTDEPFPWEERLAPATRANVKRAIEWFERRHETGKGDFWDAAARALSDPDVDTIVALTDGVPTGDRRWNLELMVELLVEKDRFRKAAFDSVLVDAPKGKARAWEDLARRTGGRSIASRVE